MSYKTILYEVKDGIAKVTLNRPEVLKAINSQLIADLNVAMKSAEDNSNLRVVIITGAEEPSLRVLT
jgi:enoyl-CoA hydratase/carnithine racemase